MARNTLEIIACLVENINASIKYHKKLIGMVVSIGTIRNTGINGIEKGR